MLYRELLKLDMSKSRYQMARQQNREKTANNGRHQETKQHRAKNAEPLNKPPDKWTTNHFLDMIELQYPQVRHTIPHRRVGVFPKYGLAHARCGSQTVLRAT